MTEDFTAAISSSCISSSLDSSHEQDRDRLDNSLIGALNSGHMTALEKRSRENTTPTTYEAFIAEEFVPRYQAKPGGARTTAAD